MHLRVKVGPGFARGVPEKTSLFGERSNRPKRDAFAVKAKASYQGRVATRGQPGALLAPDKSGKCSPNLCF